MRQVYRDVVVWDSSREKAERCDVVTEDGKFAKIAPAGSINYGCAYEGRGRTAMLPGFVNAHGHPVMVLLRGLGEELPLMEWLEKRIWPVENRLLEGHFAAGANLAMMEMLSTGTTCFSDHYMYENIMADAALEAGMRCGLARGLQNDKGRRLKENLELAAQYNGAKGLITVQLGPHAVYTVSFDNMKNFAEIAAEKNLGLQVHWLETADDWKLSGQAGKMTPEEYIEETGMLNVPSLILAHGVWIDRDAMGFYAKDNITVVHNPKSNLKLGSGIAPVSGLLENNVRLALGTDGAASNNRLDMWEEMRFAALMQKGATNDPTKLTAVEAFKMATVAGAKALGFENTGLIREGYNADMALVDLDRPHYIGWDEENLPGCLVYAGSSSDVLATVVAGEVLYENGEFRTIDKDKAMAEGTEARNYLTGK